MHSGLILLLWLLLMMLLSSLGAMVLAVALLVLSVCCGLWARTRSVRLLRRVRLLLLMIVFFFAFFTPGTALWSQSVPGPSREGLLLAWLHGGRLLALVLAVALLLEHLSAPRLVNALYGWLRLLPGVAAERIAVRLLLVLREIEYGDFKQWRRWLVDGAMPPPAALEPIVLQPQALGVADKLFLLALALLAAGWFFRQELFL